MQKRTKSLRGQIFLLMAVIAIVECVVLISVVFLTGVFTELDAEAFRFFNNDASERVLSLDNKTGLLIRNITSEATAVSTDAQAIAEEAGVPLDELYMHDELYQSLAEKCTQHLIEFLNGNSVSGAYFVLNGSNTRKEDGEAHSAVYIRDSAPGVQENENENLQLEVGPIAVSKSYGITVSNHWSLDMQIPAGKNSSFYHNPIAACIEYPHSETVRYGYWSPPGSVLPSNPEGVAYSLPLLDRRGNPCGVVGFDIALSFYTTDYFSNTNLPYSSSFFAITSGNDQELDTSWVIPGNPMAQAYLTPDVALSITPVQDTGLYETRIENLGEMYCSVNELNMYSKNSPFFDEHWILTGMVQQSVLNETSTRIRNMLFTSMAITLVVAFFAITFLTAFSTRKISGLSAYIDRLDPQTDIQLAPTNLREIDELTTAIVRLNKRINDNAKVTSKMMELTQLPLGGFEVDEDLGSVTLTEFIYELLHMDKSVRLTAEQWHKIYEKLTEKPAEGYADVYHYTAADLEGIRYGNVLPATEDVFLKQVREADGEDVYYYLDAPEQRQKWLRIIEAPTENGTVGMILDVTVDIEEMMRLAHELDYDALTHLYNRTAFKREAFKKIKSTPDKVGAMIFSDLDNLKYVNDTFGHEMGDKLITTASDMFRRFVQSGGIVARISGDEFAIFLYGFDSRDEIMGIVNRVREEGKKEHLLTPDGTKHDISYSSGVAWYPEDSTDVSDLLKLSDYAMYEAKHSDKGKGSLFEYSQQDYEKNAHMLKDREEIARLIDEGRFHFAFQPIVALDTREIYGYEALLRSELEYFSTPEEILAAARAQSRLGQLESAVIMKALFVVKRHIETIGGRKIFINSGSNQCLSERETDTIRHVYKDILDNIVMEITEAENDDPQKMDLKLDMFRNLGVQIALDDFGAGYSNETRIVAMNPNIVKIDIPLIQGVHSDTAKQKLIANLVAFCHAGGIKVAAEGVETESDLETVIRLNMDYAQGILLGAPEFGFEPLSQSAIDILRKLDEFGER